MRLYILLLIIFNCNLASAFEYKLGAGDKIQVVVYNEPDLSTQEEIDQSGVITFPFLGDIKVVGLSAKELEEKIKAGLLGDYLIDPQVSVSIVKHRPFFIHGQVKRPGGYPYQDDLTLDKAIAVAGGLAERASNTNWTITRKVEGKQIILEADVSTKVNPDDIIKIEQSFF